MLCRRFGEVTIGTQSCRHRAVREGRWGSCSLWSEALHGLKKPLLARCREFPRHVTEAPSPGGRDGRESVGSHGKAGSGVVPGRSSIGRDRSEAGVFSPFLPPSSAVTPGIWSRFRLPFFIRFQKEISFCAPNRNPQTPQIFPTPFGKRRVGQEGCCQSLRKNK